MWSGLLDHLFVNSSNTKSNSQYYWQKKKKPREEKIASDKLKNTQLGNDAYINVIFVVVYVQLSFQFEASCWSELPSYTRTEHYLKAGRAC